MKLKHGAEEKVNSQDAAVNIWSSNRTVQGGWQLSPQASRYMPGLHNSKGIDTLGVYIGSGTQNTDEHPRN